MGNSVGSTLLAKSDRQESRYHLQVTIMKGTSQLAVGAQLSPLTFTEGDAQAFNHQFISILEELGSDVRSKGVDLTGYKHDYLRDLCKLGKAAYNKFLHSSTRQYFQTKEAAEKQRGLSLTFQTPIEFSFFWEMLYSGTPKVEPEQFWGFRYPIGRTYWGEFDLSDRVQLQKGILSAIHHKLKYSQQEVEQVARHLELACQRLRLKLSLHLLEQIISANSLCQDSFINSLLELFNDPDFCYGIIHFACHCWQSQDIYTPQAYLSLTAHEQKLEIELESLLAWQEYGFQNRPFVFLNACGSATPSQLLQTLSFPSGMLNFGAAGVIATACTIPDNFASAFASKFYELLLGKLEINTLVNISEVLLETRLYFLQKRNNPLGLAYGLYAPSNQLLRD